MRRLIIKITLLALTFHNCCANGIQCWVCTSQTTNEDCNASAFQRGCRPAEVCENTFRLVGSRVLITKRCTEARRCSNRCIRRGDTAICRQCCSSDGCNHALMTPQMSTTQTKSSAGTSLTPRIQASTSCESIFFKHGSMRCVRLKGNSVGTTCLFWCRHGYILRGPTRLTCTKTDNGVSWSGAPPICSAKQRAQYHANPGGCRGLEYDKMTTEMKCSNGFNFRSACTFTCKDGFSMFTVEDNVRIKSVERRVVCWRGVRQPVVWTQSVPRCVRKKCAMIIHNLYSIAVCTNWIRVNSVCDFSCSPGYRRVGPQYLACSDDGVRTASASWNDTIPTCEPRECSPIEIPDAVTYACSSGNFFTSRCTFICDEGYFMTNYQRTTVLSKNGDVSICNVSKSDEMVWTPGPPKCILKACPDVSNITNGHSECSNENYYLSTCTFTCSDGFLLMGVQSMTCMDDEETENSDTGQWNAEKPWCRPKVCEPLLYEDENLEMTCSDGYNYRSECTFTCKTGYYMTTADELTFVQNGILTSTCAVSAQKTLAWFPPDPPVCHTKSCHALDAPENGHISCTDGNNHDSVCSFTCSTGYALDGKESIICEDKGSYIPKETWSHDPPVCKAKPCPKMVYDEKTTDANCSKGLSFLSNCIFNCKEGYYMTSAVSGNIVDLAMSLCALNEIFELEWTEPAPKCLLKQCLQLSPPNNGEMKCSAGTAYNSKCKFTCLPGYQTKTEDTLRCEDDGQNTPEGRWSHDPPECEPRSCDEFDIDIHSLGVICDSEFKFMSECEFHCMEGHYMTDAVGSEIIDSSTAKCGVVGNRMVWSNDPPICKEKSCTLLSQPPRGLLRCSKASRYGSTCALMCSPGFSVSGTTPIYCEDNGINDPNGQWSEEPPTCERRLCEQQEMEIPDILREECSNEYAFESICNYTCADGFYQITEGDVAALNMAQIKCGVTGRDMTWSSPLPNCDVITCPTLSDPENGKVTCPDGIQYGAKCIYSCQSGYELKVDNSVTCIENVGNDPIGRWSEASPVCEPRRCGKISYDSEILFADCDNNDKFQSVCKFSCNVGYYTQSQNGSEFQSTTVCTVDKNDNMVWSNKPPTCQVKSCEPHDAFDEGTMTCTNDTFFQSTCSFSCSPGFGLSGNLTSTCSDLDRDAQYGNWSSPLPTCEARPCPDLQFDEKTVTVKCSAEDKFRSVCRFGCVEGYYMAPDGKKIVNEPTTTCDVEEDDMYWTEKAPTCMIKHCKSIRKPVDGQVICTDENKYASKCSFSCSIFREVHGQETITCGADDRNIPEGVWTAPFPTCKLRSCPDWAIDRRAIVETCTNDYKYGSSCSFSCNEGYYLPTKMGETSSGHTTAQCGIKGTVMTWTGGPPACKIKTCAPMTYPINGTYACSDNYDYDTRCTFTCIRGFLLIGREVIRCEDDGSDLPTGIWSAKEPVCEARSCDDLVYDYDTQDAECSHGKKYSSVCELKCKEGYYMTGSDGITLQDSAQIVCDVNPENNRAVLWKGDKPKCFLKNCKKIKPPTDGSFICDAGTKFGSRCIFECLPGFKLVGYVAASCNDNGRNVPEGYWSKSAPVCEPKSCARLTNSVNTTTFKCTDGWKYMSVCTFACKEGHFFQGGVAQPMTECGRGTGTGMSWTNPVPICLSKFCLAIRPKRNMTMSCTDGFRYNSRCKFSCDSPMKLVGPPVLKCLDDTDSTFTGEWDGKPWNMKCRNK